ncbi:MAG: hypothetical protein Tsb0020_53850 [Haliangiales bacterium]
MLFAEEHAGWLLVLHTICAGALVAATTHLVVWMRGFARSRPGRIRAVRKFAFICAALYVSAMILGNLMYPVYKVRVRVEYLEQPGAVVRDGELRREVAARALESHRALMSAGGQDENGPAPGLEGVAGAAGAAERERAAERPRRAAKLARWFDVKEHWAALGCALMLGCALALRAWDPKRHSAAVAPILFLMALGSCAATWLAAIVGIAVSGYRAVGGL